MKRILFSSSLRLEQTAVKLTNKPSTFRPFAVAKPNLELP